MAVYKNVVLILFKSSKLGQVIIEKKNSNLFKHMYQQNYNISEAARVDEIDTVTHKVLQHNVQFALNSNRFNLCHSDNSTLQAKYTVGF